MIVVKVELWPHGHADQRRELGQGIIFNDLSGSWEQGNYRFSFSSPEDDSYVRAGNLQDFPRTRRNAWELLRRCLNEVEKL